MSTDVVCSRSHGVWMDRGWVWSLSRLRILCTPFDLQRARWKPMRAKCRMRPERGGVRISQPDLHRGSKRVLRSMRSRTSLRWESVRRPSTTVLLGTAQKVRRELLPGVSSHGRRRRRGARRAVAVLFDRTSSQPRRHGMQSPRTHAARRTDLTRPRDVRAVACVELRSPERVATHRALRRQHRCGLRRLGVERPEPRCARNARVVELSLR